jgi:fucose permease
MTAAVALIGTRIRLSVVPCAAMIGLGFSAIFPTTLAQAGAAFPRYSGTAFSVIFVMALTGGMTAPWMVGRIAQNHGVGAGFWVTVAGCAAIAALQGMIAAMTRKSR